MDRTTLTANLKPLERRDLVRVTVDAADKRGRRLVLTPPGRAALAVAMPLWQQIEQSIERLVGDPSQLREDLLALS